MFGFSESDHIFKEWRNTKTFYEEPLLTKIKSLDIRGCYVDAGANQGNHTIFFSEFCNSSEIVSVEASKEIIPLLERNLADNVSKGHEIYQRCLCDRIGLKAQVFGEVSPDNCGGTSFAVTLDGSGDVATTTLDNILLDKDVGLIKLDIEGMELVALQGGVKTIERCKPVIVAEALSRTAMTSLNDFLSGFGYRVTYSYSRTHCWEIR
jgi:FkbM family methyltransferase